MKKKGGNDKISIVVQDKAYFHSDTYIKKKKLCKEDMYVCPLNRDIYIYIYINLESTDVKEILAAMIYKILEKIGEYQQNGSGWYFKEVVHLEIHTVEYNPMRGSSYISLPDWIMRKKAIVNITNTDEKCFLWCVLRYLHPREKNDIRLTDLKQYENDFNTK